MTTLIKNEAIESMRTAGSIVKDCLEFLSHEVKDGISTKTLDAKAGKFINSRNGKAAFLGYKGFPANICASRNDVVVHGIPRDDDFLKEGDILSVDVGVNYKGYFADAAKTFPVGKISMQAEKLISVTKKALEKGIEMARRGNRIQDISWTIQSHVESNGFSVVRAFVGHGIGKKIHQEPEVPNFGEPHKGAVLENGMGLAIEPMVNAGTADVKISENGWTAKTKDGELSAHFEHTIIVDEESPEIIT